MSAWRSSAKMCSPCYTARTVARLERPRRHCSTTAKGVNVLTLHPGEVEFPASEYADRVDRARARMAELNVDALMVTGDFLSAFNHPYFTGHLPRDFQTTTDRTHVFVLTREGGAAICSHPE